MTLSGSIPSRTYDHTGEQPNTFKDAFCPGGTAQLCIRAVKLSLFRQAGTEMFIFYFLEAAARISYVARNDEPQSWKSHRIHISLVKSVIVTPNASNGYS